MGSFIYAYEYGMRLRGFSPGAQPKEGLLYVWDDINGKYWCILEYDRELTEDEVRNYDLDFLGVVQR